MPLSHRRTFASDNWSGVHPDILAALVGANARHAPAYGKDLYTKRVEELLKAEFGPGLSAQLYLTGTAANTVAVATLLQARQAVLCADAAHVFVIEEEVQSYFSDARFLLMPTADGRITPDDIERRLREEDARRDSPNLLVLTNATEYGTLYTLQETKELVACAHRHGLLVYMDGARLANAAAALDLSLADMVVEAEVDAFSIGGTKNGLLYGEAVIFRDGGRFAASAEKLRKFGLQNAAKLRFVAAQFEAYLQNGLWKKIARQANAAAELLASELGKRGVPVVQKREINHVWAKFSSDLAQSIADERYGYLKGSDCNRFVTSWDTEVGDIHDFMAWLDDRLTL